MLNQVVLVGRLTRDVELRELESGTKVANITLAIDKPFRSENGEKEVDFIDVTLWNGVAESTAKYCGKGSLIAAKGRIDTQFRKENDGKNIKSMNIVAEKISFLDRGKENKSMER